jgi:hypothetical protein
MKTRWMAGAVLAALALWGGTSPDLVVMAGSKTGYFGSGHDAGQGHAALVPAAEVERA